MSNTPDNSGAVPDPNDLAAEALRAAQAAVSSLKTQTTPVTAASGGDDAAAAALLAAQQAIAAAKAINPPLGDETIGAGAQPMGGGAMGGSQMGAGMGMGGGAQPQAYNFQSFSPNEPQNKPEGIDLLSDVNLQVKIELGRTRMVVEDVLRLGEGSVVELDKLAGDPVDVYVNDRHVARGEVLVLNDNFCVRINEIISVVDDAPVRK